MRLHDPWALVLLALVALLVRLRRGPAATISFPALAGVLAGPLGRRARWRWLLPALRATAVALLIFALARPQISQAPTAVFSEGIDMVLAVDVSGSMLAEDFTIEERRVNRLEAVKTAVERFLEDRAGDRVGLVLFAARPYTQCPLTLDHGWLLQNLERASVGMIEDGTAIGSALATAVNRLEASSAQSKVVILLTDGQNNAGKVTPQAAAESAKALGYKVYTIAAGTRGLAPYPARDMFGNRIYRPVQVDVDEESLKTIAATTGGRFYRATDTAGLMEIYEQIDELEKSPQKGLEHLSYRELYRWPVYPAFILLLLEALLAMTVLRVLP